MYTYTQYVRAMITECKPTCTQLLLSSAFTLTCYGDCTVSKHWHAGPIKGALLSQQLCNSSVSKKEQKIFSTSDFTVQRDVLCLEGQRCLVKCFCCSCSLGLCILELRLTNAKVVVSRHVQEIISGYLRLPAFYIEVLQEAEGLEPY